VSVEIKLLTPFLPMHESLKTRNEIARQLPDGIANSKMALKGIN